MLLRGKHDVKEKSDKQPKMDDMESGKGSPDT